MRGGAERLRVCILISSPLQRMNVHNNARLTPRGREAVGCAASPTTIFRPRRSPPKPVSPSARCASGSHASAPRAAPGSRIALHDHSTAQSRRRPRRSPWCSRCAACACQASRSPGNARFPRPPSLASCAATACIGSRCSSPPRQGCVTSANFRASCSILISRNLGRIVRPSHRVTHDPSRSGPRRGLGVRPRLHR